MALLALDLSSRQASSNPFLPTEFFTPIKAGPGCSYRLHLDHT
jgi:hypothetical protein